MEQKEQFPRVVITEASKTSWSTKAENEAGYPGDKNMEIGCLQRIANATEVMSPLLDWFHKQKDIPLGSRMSVVILERLNQSAEERNILKGQRDLALKALHVEKERADRLEAYLDRIATGAIPYNYQQALSWIETARQLANEALSTQTDKT